MLKENKERFGLRKLSVGLASVMLGVMAVNSVKGTTVHADTVNGNDTKTVANSDESDTKENNQVKDAKVVKEVAPQLTADANKADANKTVATTVRGGTDLSKNSDKSVTSDENKENVTNKKTAENADAGKTVENIVKTPTSQETTQSFSVRKNIQAVSENAVKSNLTQESNSDDWGTDPSKYGFHKTNAGWTKLQQGKDYTSVAKKANTILLKVDTGQELPKDNRIELSDTFKFGTDITATINANDIKKGNRILLSSIAFLDKDTRHFVMINTPQMGNVHVISNGVQIGHIETIANPSSWVTGNSAGLNYVLVVDQTQKLVKDFDLHIKMSHTTDADGWSNHWNFFRGTTPDNPTYVKAITNDSNTYQYTFYVDPSKKVMPQHISDSNTIGTGLSQDLSWGELYLGSITHDPNKSFTSQDYTVNKVLKFSRPKSVSGVPIPNFKSVNFTPRLVMRRYFPVMSKDGFLDWSALATIEVSASKMADGASVQQVTEAAKNKHVVYSISNDGQSMLIGINMPVDRDSLAKLNYDHSSMDDLINKAKQGMQNTRTLAIDYPDQADDIVNRSVAWIKDHNGEPQDIGFDIQGWPCDQNQPNIQTVSDVTIGAKNPVSITNNLFPKNDDISFDASVYRQLNVKFVDDDDNEKVINTDTLTTSTGTDLTYNVKLSTDPTFNSDTDIAFPKNFLLADKQPTTVHYGVVQDKNPDIIIHIKHLVKTVDGSINLDDYPNIKKALNGDSTRTFHITYPAGRQGSNPSTIVQSIHFIRSGKADFSIDSVTPSTLTAWVPVASTAKGVTITNGVARFDSITLPRVAGYTAEIKQNPQNKMMYLVSFVANPVPNVPKADDNKTIVDQGSITIDNKDQNKIHDNGHGDVTIEAPSDKNKDKEAVIPSTPSNIDVPNSKNDNGQDWQISSIKTHDYIVSNGKDEFSLPISENSALNIIKTNDQTLAFNYIKLNVPSDYVFIISKRRKMYQLSVLKQNNGKWQVVKIFKSRDYKSLMKELKKLVY